MSAPFRADHVGSLLRPPRLADARAAFARGQCDPAELRDVEDQCIRELVARQERIGLPVVTDGELRRSWWHYDFLAGLDGVELVIGGPAASFHGIQTRSENITVTGRVGFSSHPMVEHFAFLHDIAGVTPKVTIPAPPVLHFRGGRANVSRSAYADMDSFFVDTAEAYRRAVRAFYDAGCRYLQFDDTVWAYLCSEKECRGCRERGDDPDALRGIYRDMINHAIGGRPDDMCITTHVCRGNFRSSWLAEGGYEPVAETLFGSLDYDGYFLEYDTERAGGFEPLRFLPPGRKRVVLGLITSKSGELEDRDQVLRRIDAASKYVPIDQCCLSPQCGFASTEEGNLLSEDEQWRKLALVVDIAREVWN